MLNFGTLNLKKVACLNVTFSLTLRVEIREEVDKEPPEYLP
jgi:hypothetical protein